MTKRAFLQAVSASVPALKLLLGKQPAAPIQGPSKFTAVDVSSYLTAAPADLGPRDRARELGGSSAKDGLLRTPAGQQSFRGIPFSLGPEDTRNKAWLALSRKQNSWSVPRVEIPIRHDAGYFCLAHFCDWDENETRPSGVEAMEKAGQHLADAVMVYEDGSQRVHPIRRRFQVNSLTVPWGHLCFAAVPHRAEDPSRLTDPLPDATMWGDLQLGVWEANYPSGPGREWFGTLWLCALENPEPDRRVQSLRLEAKSDDPLFLCGLTLYHGSEHPLRYDRLRLYRITLPPGVTEKDDEWRVEVDLGVVVRSFRLPEFEPEHWLKSPEIGLGEQRQPDRAEYLYSEVSASPGATLTLRNTRTGSRWDFELGKLAGEAELAANESGASVQVIERDKVWLCARVADKSTGKPTPVRISFRSKDSRYIPPYGHRTEINRSWFQDYGADLKTGDSPFAYVDGSFQIELPAGDVYLEMTKGFEYEPVRQKLTIRPDQRELNLEISRFADLRSKNWVSADSHVHFLSPTTAVLEGQAEGVNLINVLAAQWGDLFTSVGDLSHGPLTSNDKETVVWVGTENRQHLLGHIGLLGSHGSPVLPMGADGPEESYIGGPLWNSLADWSDACRRREGLAVAVHFPYPTAELAADIVLGKIDAVELWPTGMDEQFNTLRFLDWYRYLNCGYRLPAVAGTDKMGAWISVGAYRGYACLAEDEFNFGNWAKAVRGGNTFMTSGPLLLFQADGKAPGAEIRLGAGGGKIEVHAEVKSAIPIHRVEIVLNGKVVASREEAAGVREITLRETVGVPGPGWLAARCASRYTSAGARVAAHTSPVYLAVPGQEIFSPPAAAYMMTLIDGAEAYVKDLATRPDAGRFARVLKVFQDARELLHRRLHRHGVAH